MGRTISEQNDAGASGLDKRKYRRKTVMWNGKLSLLWGARLMGNEQTVPGVVRDMSVSGARFQTKQDFRPTNDVILEVPRFGAFNCNLVWQNGHIVGLSFVDPPEFIFNTVNGALPGISLDPNPVH
ncbi:PilZ domain-containing protein [Sneathiella sp.]|uniref:PilZ domain-containing protein n=1 Tax=Sneathiella sp. TaxID=1964365 RepID=UPI002628119D|nr:PilZ domain-containing protein [Sneathiella sp.]MDF2366749.1 PilZ domain-containing protein [Sneathiella sp.]